jgi:hypothetical protein
MTTQDIIGKPMFFPQFFDGRGQRYPSCCERDIDYATYKMTAKPERNSIPGKFWQNPHRNHAFRGDLRQQKALKCP